MHLPSVFNFAMHALCHCRMCASVFSHVLGNDFADLRQHLAAVLTLCAIGRAPEHIRALQQIVYGHLKKIRDSQADIQRGSCVSVFQSGDIFLIAVQRCRKLFLRASALFPVRFDVLPENQIDRFILHALVRIRPFHCSNFFRFLLSFRVCLVIAIEQMLLVFQEGLLFTRQLAVCLPGRVDRFLVLRRELGADIRGELCNQLTLL